MSAPHEAGYYWAKLKTPSDGTTYNEGKRFDFKAEPEWASTEWEIVKVNENDPFGDPEGDEFYSVWVPGIPVTQWVGDFFWGPKLNITAPADQVPA